MTRRQWLVRAAAGGAALAMGTAGYAWWIEPHWVRVGHVRMPIAGLPPSHVGKRLVQISDLHVGPIVDNNYLRGVLRRLAELEPDYLVVTGDFMTCHGDEQVALAIDTLREAPIADVPTVGILGNHDYSDSFRSRSVADRLSDGIRGLGVTMLRNESARIDGIQFAGCDDLWLRRCRPQEALAGLDLTQPTVCLAHNPDSVDRPGWGDYRGWILSGHTHGGQVRLPFIGAPILPIRNHRYAAGRVALRDGRTLYVNCGVGYKRRVRLGVRPEVTVFTLATA